MHTSMVVALSPWRASPQAGEPLGNRLERALRPWAPTPIVSGHAGLVLVEHLTPGGTLAVLDATLRGHKWAAAVLLRSSTQPRFTATRVARESLGSPWGVAVRLDRSDPAAAPVHAALALHATILRQRTRAMWAAIDAVAEHGSTVAAATALDCSHQAVSRHLQRAQLKATEQTGALLDALLTASEVGPTQG